jgi:hypothetical protein
VPGGFVEIAADRFADVNSFSNVNDLVFVVKFVDAGFMRQVAYYCF